MVNVSVQGRNWGHNLSLYSSQSCFHILYLQGHLYLEASTAPTECLESEERSPGQRSCLDLRKVEEIQKYLQPIIVFPSPSREHGLCFLKFSQYFTFYYLLLFFENGVVERVWRGLYSQLLRRAAPVQLQDIVSTSLVDSSTAIPRSSYLNRATRPLGHQCFVNDGLSFFPIFSLSLSVFFLKVFTLL